MNVIDFTRILTAFADREADVDLERGKLLVQVREELIEARLISKLGNIHVEENNSLVSAEYWIVDRLARLRQLADRILTYLPVEEHFVVPSGQHLDLLDRAPDEQPEMVDNVVVTLKDVLSRPTGGMSSILYLTSHAGEGKTTVINRLARDQAQEYKNGKSEWLLVPISLGGRPFLRLDDVTIGALVNRFRFPYLFYDAFIELVRLGALVPALDGFEEMFVETASGDAVSALGNLVQALNSSGCVLIAARKAYFEYQGLQTQSRLYESLGNCSVSFAKLSIQRWNKHQFINYCKSRGIVNPEEIYDRASSILAPEHPVLTRAVLVKRLIDVFEDAEDQTKVYEHLCTFRQGSPTEFFDQFVNTIVKREVAKWIDKSGTPVTPLLTLEQQHELLSDLAEEMWVSNTNSLRGEVMDLVSEVFCERNDLAPSLVRQIIERAKQHSLITSAEEQPGTFRFDHEEFYHYYLGLVLARRLSTLDEPGFRTLLRNRIAPPIALDVAAHHVRREFESVSKVIDSLVTSCQSESQGSCMRENSGALAARLIADGDRKGVILEGLIFPADSLRGKAFINIAFKNSYFYPILLENTRLEKCIIENCEFQRMEIGSNVIISDTKLIGNTVHYLRDATDKSIFDPEEIALVLSRYGFILPEKIKALKQVNQRVWDDELTLSERAFRAFWRATEVNDNVFRIRLGSRSSEFFDKILPRLLASNVLAEVQYKGSGRQKRFRLNIQMLALENAFSRCEGNFDKFLSLAGKKI